jgi:hypothetical protein
MTNERSCVCVVSPKVISLWESRRVPGFYGSSQSPSCCLASSRPPPARPLFWPINAPSHLAVQLSQHPGSSAVASCAVRRPARPPVRQNIFRCMYSENVIHIFCYKRYNAAYRSCELVYEVTVEYDIMLNTSLKCGCVCWWCRS